MLVILQATIILGLHLNLPLTVAQESEIATASEFFDVTLITPVGDEFSDSYISTIVEAFREIGINIISKRVVYDEFEERTFYHPIGNYPLYEEGGFDISLVSFENDT
ncbi:MAG: hypothetical protein ACXAD7_19730 [Candidatus Kariarchaeaceae archaeon]